MKVELLSATTTLTPHTAPPRRELDTLLKLLPEMATSAAPCTAPPSVPDSTVRKVVPETETLLSRPLAAMAPPLPPAATSLKAHSRVVTPLRAYRAPPCAGGRGQTQSDCRPVIPGAAKPHEHVQTGEILAMCSQPHFLSARARREPAAGRAHRPEQSADSAAARRRRCGVELALKKGRVAPRADRPPRAGRAPRGGNRAVPEGGG